MTKGIYLLTVYFSLAFLVFSVLVINIYSNEYDNQKIKYDEFIQDLRDHYNKSKFDDRCIMYDRDGLFERYEQSNINGLYYYGDQFYMVWVKDRTIDEIEKTDRHEYCHYLVDEDFEHFCE